jgi:hypothetical protein
MHVLKSFLIFSGRGDLRLKKENILSGYFDKYLLCTLWAFA